MSIFLWVCTAITTGCLVGVIWCFHSINRSNAEIRRSTDEMLADRLRFTRRSS